MSTAEAEARELQVEAQGGLWREAFERLRRNPGAIVGAAVILAFVLTAVFASQIAPFDPRQQVGGLSVRPPGPSADHVFGLDGQGRDVFSRVVFGTRLSLIVGLVSVAVGLSIGFVLGATAGYLGGKVDAVVMRVMDVLLSIPALLIAIALVTLLGRGLIQVMVAVGVTTIPVFARLLRGSILAQREADYVLAARAVGVPGHRILLRHILPNALAPVVVQATLAVATAIIDVAALSFLGLGPADPALPEWGQMLAEAAPRLQNTPHLVLFPGAAIVVSVLAINLIGDGLREALDPRFKL
jgi:peptide/nickel transport system permease protein